MVGNGKFSFLACIQYVHRRLKMIDLNEKVLFTWTPSLLWRYCGGRFWIYFPPLRWIFINAQISDLTKIVRNIQINKQSQFLITLIIHVHVYQRTNSWFRHQLYQISKSDSNIGLIALNMFTLELISPPFEEMLIDAQKSDLETNL